MQRLSAWLRVRGAGPLKPAWAYAVSKPQKRDILSAGATPVPEYHAASPSPAGGGTERSWLSALDCARQTQRLDQTQRLVRLVRLVRLLLVQKVSKPNMYIAAL